MLVGRDNFESDINRADGVVGEVIRRGLTRISDGSLSVLFDWLFAGTLR